MLLALLVVLFSLQTDLLSAVNVAGEKAIQRLMEGNRQFRRCAELRMKNTVARRTQLLPGQEPIAAILCCSDSRICPEIIFGLGLGDLFVVRVVGNVATPSVLASLEYAITQLDVPLLLVMSHSDCGAISSALEKKKRRLGIIYEELAPALSFIEKSEEGMSSEQKVELAARYNARRTVQAMFEKSSALRAKVDKGRLTILPLHYNLESGEVMVLQALTTALL